MARSGKCPPKTSPSACSFWCGRAIGSADGVIVSGNSAIDEAPVTGESTPVRKDVNAAVFAGTVNGETALRICVTAAAVDNTIARVVKLVEEAQERKAPTERFIDRFSRYYVVVLPPLMFGGVWNEWIYKGLAILLIGCPCALVISTPAACVSRCARKDRRPPSAGVSRSGRCLPRR
jgi:Zn2+/Cd2+-exporting ATPase